MQNKQEIIAIIPARGGSKRIKNKNIRDFCGHPLIYYTIMAALKSEKIDRVIVSTEDETIGKIAIEYGAEVIWRPVQLSGDYATTVSVLEHCIKTLQDNAYIFNTVVTLQPTNPLRPLGLIDTIIDFYVNNSLDSLFTVSKSRNKLGRIIDNSLIPLNYKFGERSQDMESIYFENGLVYLSSVDFIMNEHNVISRNAFPYLIEEFYGEIDIDEEIDFELAIFFYKKYKHFFKFI